MNEEKSISGNIPIFTSDAVPEGWVGLYAPGEYIDVISLNGSVARVETKAPQLIAILDPSKPSVSPEQAEEN